jgi:hypothetical protein
MAISGLILFLGFPVYITENALDLEVEIIQDEIELDIWEKEFAHSSLVKENPIRAWDISGDIDKGLDIAKDNMENSLEYDKKLIQIKGNHEKTGRKLLYLKRVIWVGSVGGVLGLIMMIVGFRNWYFEEKLNRKLRIKNRKK